MERVSRSRVDAMFATLVRVASAAGIDTVGWSFGKHYGNYFVILDPSRASGTALSRSWRTNREAFDGMQDMVNALMMVNVKA